MKTENTVLTAIALAIAKIIAGVSIIGLLYWWLGGEYLLLLVKFILIPCLFLMLAFRLITFEAAKLFWNEGFQKRVEGFVAEIKAERDGSKTATATA